MRPILKIGYSEFIMPNCETAGRILDVLSKATSVNYEYHSGESFYILTRNIPLSIEMISEERVRPAATDEELKLNKAKVDLDKAEATITELKALTESLMSDKIDQLL